MPVPSLYRRGPTVGHLRRAATHSATLFRQLSHVPPGMSPTVASTLHSETRVRTVHSRWSAASERACAIRTTGRRETATRNDRGPPGGCRHADRPPRRSAIGRPASGRPSAWYSSTISCGIRPRSETLMPFACAHARIALFCSRSAAAPPRPGAAARPPTTTPPRPILRARADVRREGVAQSSPRSSRQVDLVLNAVERELHRLLGVAAVEVVDEHVNRSAWPPSIPSRAGCASRNCARTITHVGPHRSSRPVPPNLLRPHQREQDRFPNAEPGERHQKPVDTHSHPARRRHSVLHRPQEVLVQPHRLRVARRPPAAPAPPTVRAARPGRPARSSRWPARSPDIEVPLLGQPRHARGAPRISGVVSAGIVTHERRLRQAARTTSSSNSSSASLPGPHFGSTPTSCLSAYSARRGHAAFPP